MKQFAACALAFAAGAAFADSIFNGVDSSGSGDLVSPGNWDVAPSSSTAVQFTKSGTLDASSSVTFGNMKFNAAGIRVVCGWDASKTVTFGEYFFYKDGVTNVIDGASVKATNFMLGQNGGTGGQHCHVVNGGDVSCKRMQVGLYNGYALLDVDGAGSKFVATGSDVGQIGNGYAGNSRVRVANGGYAQFNTSGSDGTRIGIMSSNRACTNNALEVSYGGFVYCGNLFLGIGNTEGVSYSVGGGGNAIEVGAGGTLSMNALTMGGNSVSVPSNVVTIAGGSVTNRTGSVVVGSVAAGQSFSVRNGSFIGLTGNDKEFSLGKTVTSDGNRAEISDRSIFDWKGRLYVGVNSSNNLFMIENAKVLTLGGGFHHVGYGATACGNTLIVSNVESSAVSGELYCGTSGSDNTVEFRDVDSVPGTKIYVGYESCAARNRFLFVPKTHLTFPRGKAVESYFAFGHPGTSNCGPDGSIEIQNVTFDYGENWSHGKSVAKCTLTLGEDVVFYLTNSTEKAFTVSAAPGTRLVLAGATFNGYVSTYIGTTKPSNTVEIVNGSVYRVSGSTSGELGKLGYGYNRLLVGDASEMTVYRWRVAGVGNEMVISNGTFTARDEFYFPYNDAATVTNLGNTLVFQGAAPRLRGELKGFSFGGKMNASGKHVDETTIRFEVPAQGYSEPPIFTAEGKNVTLKAGTRLTADVEAFRKAGGGKVVLAKTSGSGVISVADMEELSSTLPDRTKLALNDAKTELSLRVASDRGLLLIVR